MVFAQDPNEIPDETPNENLSGESEQLEVGAHPTTDAVAPAAYADARRRSPIKVTRHGLIVFGLLVVILVAGGYFRFVGQNWDDYTHLHPDERFLTGVATSLGGSLNPSGNQDQASQQQTICNDRYPDTKGAAPSIFDSLCSTWYPKNASSGTGLYVYGEFPLFIIKWTALTMNDLSKASPAIARFFDSDYYDQRNAPRNWDDYNGIHLVGRFISAAAELLSLVFLFLIGRRLYNDWVGLLAAALGAAAVFPIQLSHFFTMDAFTNLPVLIAFWFATRAMDRGRWLDFAGFGIALGAAVASRINVAFLAVVIVLAALIYALPAFDMSLVSRERSRLILRAVGGVVLAGVLTVFAFRMTMPHAFRGGPGILGFFDIGPAENSFSCPTQDYAGIVQAVSSRIFYCPWLADLGSVQNLTSGAVDFPPDHQWASRTPYLFPLKNIVLFGMGLPLGLMACFGWLWAAIQIVRGKPLWTRHMLPVVWILVYFAYMGRQWVMTMRYFMPIYPFLILLASWAMVEIVARAFGWLRVHPTAVRRGAAYTGAFLLIVVVASTFLYATMFVRIYERQLTRVEASRWVLANLPSAISANLTLPDGRTRLINFGVVGTIGQNITRYANSEPHITPFVPSARSPIDRVVVTHLIDPQHTAKSKRFNVAIALNEDGSQIVAHGAIDSDFGAAGNPLGAAYTIMLDTPVSPDTNRGYYLLTWAQDALIVSRRDGLEHAEFTLSNANGDKLAEVRLPDSKTLSGNGPGATAGDQPIQATFTAPADGTITSLTIPHLLNPLGDNTKTDFVVKLLDDRTNQAIAQGTVSGDFSSTHTSIYGDPFTVKLDKPVTIAAKQQFRIEASNPQGAPLQVTGTVIANEGPWDDPVPWKVCPMPPTIDLTHDTPSGILPVTCEGVDGFSWYKGPELQMALEDDDQKRQEIQKGLDQADYFTISSNRFYDSLARIPLRYPMSIAFYKALFSGQLGFDPVKTITSYPSIGNFEIADQYLPTYQSFAPAWLNELESEEAFSVYDHPTVFILKKNANYSSQNLAAVLDVPTAAANTINVGGEQSTTLINRITWSAKEASPAPTGLQLTADQRTIQQQGGTWSDLFNRDSPVNSSQVLSVVIWWLVLMLIGLAAWPILFVLLPGLPDRGYPVAKIAGLLIIGWIVWAGGTIRLLTWSQAGIALTLLGMIVVSGLVAVRYHEAMIEYVRLNWRHMLIVEMITLVLFLAFLFVRLGNPDLWAQVLGGEKPMDFAYFNAVLRSTVFPPYDPWYAGGYLNYYYFGYVLVGVPVKLLGVEPSIAYNLIVPTLFALTGIAAFCVAFNIVASRWFYPHDEGSETGESPRERRRFALRVPSGSPYIAGVMALLLCVVLGNLDTPRQFLLGLGKAGGYNADTQQIYNWKVSDFFAKNGRQPTPEENDQLAQDAAHPSTEDQIRFALYDSTQFFSSIGRGFGQVLSGGLLPISPDRWFWGPTRIVSELPNASNEINEMPYFTFVYGDLHAHMIAFPLTLLALAWLLSEVLAAGHIVRPGIVVAASTIFGALIVGALQATNTWDWITYLLLGVLGLIFAMVLRRQRLSKRVMIAYGSQLIGFLAAQWFFALPFTMYWSTAYLSGSAFKSFDGSKTPIWAYFDIHGVFLFAVVSLLAWQTVRLLRKVYIRDFIGRAGILLLLISIIIGTIALSLIMTFIPAHISLLTLPIPLSILCVPLLVWCVILFLIPDQPREWRVVYALIGLALAVSFGVEIIVLGADIGRQNTFFKFYLQAWILFSVAAGVAFSWLFNAAPNWRGILRTPWLIVLVILLAIAGLFTIMSTEGKIAMRMAANAPHTLDGDAYMNYATYFEGSAPLPLGDDFQMIQWLEDNVKGSPAILEGYMTEYKYGARISINTGLPSIIGWNFHQRQQRTIDPLPNLVWQRIANVTTLYDSTDITAVWRMLKFYNVEYIVVGKLENLIYAPEGIAKFEDMVNRKLLEVVYNARGDKIYHVIPGSQLPASIVGGR